MVALPYTLTAKRVDRLVPAAVGFLLPGAPILVFFLELARPDDEPGAFGTAGMVALAVATVPLLAVAVWFARRASRMSVAVDTDRLVVHNIFRTYSIPWSEVLWVEERLMSHKGLSAIEIRAQHGERSRRLDAASADPESADEFQADLIEILQHLAAQHGFRLRLINASDG